MPFAGFKDFEECKMHVKDKNPNYTDEQISGVCGMIEQRHKEKIEKEEKY